MGHGRLTGPRWRCSSTTTTRSGSSPTLSRAETFAEPEPITDVAHRQGWTVISMARDWDTIFAADQ